MVGHFHGDDDEIDAGVGDQLTRIVEGVDTPLGSGAPGRFGATGRNGAEVVLWQRLYAGTCVRRPSLLRGWRR